ncbi:Hypothetical predicted protein [Lecanosticta acicola]|uniref:F-box domain-containing protein n=1 Tax=Lecanosticta acicola TaxID=111012 RepID=A0AAI8YYL7_9PEZI|nr:Hypothetical predicted protein [Lecanosticta acicola]
MDTSSTPADARVSGVPEDGDSGRSSSAEGCVPSAYSRVPDIPEADGNSGSSSSAEDPPPSAATRVFGIPELFEQIFLRVHLETLLLAQRTSRDFRSNIQGSKKLLRRLYLLPSDEAPEQDDFIQSVENTKLERERELLLEWLDFSEVDKVMIEDHLSWRKKIRGRSSVIFNPFLENLLLQRKGLVIWPEASKYGPFVGRLEPCIDDSDSDSESDSDSDGDSDSDSDHAVLGLETDLLYEQRSSVLQHMPELDQGRPTPYSAPRKEHSLWEMCLAQPSDRMVEVKLRRPGTFFSRRDFSGGSSIRSFMNWIEGECEQDTRNMELPLQDYTEADERQDE